MTSENEYQENGTDKGYSLIGGIYRVVKSIDEKMETVLDETRDWIESGEENDWFGREGRNYYE